MPKKQSELNKTQLRILAEIRNNPNVTRRQLILILPVGDNTIYKGLSVLKKRGYIERVGSKKSGYWKVNDITNPNDAKDNLVDG
ncbi:MAG: hypothetical protein IJM54_10530 [Thermoguttaceae bacterium]|nr:hypothetical protein [Thermoguttaceae bacterium]